MRRLIFFVLGFVLALALLLNMGCATARDISPDILDGLMNELELEGPKESYQVPEGVRRGWSPLSESGNHWILRDYIGGKLYILARCDYTYRTVSGVEKWKGTYFGMADELNFGGPVYDNRLENLVGCVDWVKNFYYGDYCI
jgi:hypothetical protein